MSVSVSLLYLPGMQNASFLLRILLLSVACLSLPYFSALSPIRHDYRKKNFNTKCEFSFFLQPFSETFRILRRIQQDAIINIHKTSYKALFIFVGF